MEKFIMFLKQYDIYEKYRYNRLKYPYYTNAWSPPSFSSPSRWIHQAFSWGYTKEGYDFWRYIDDMWRKKITLGEIYVSLEKKKKEFYHNDK